MTKISISELIDHTNSKPEAAKEDIKVLCSETASGALNGGTFRKSICRLWQRQVPLVSVPVRG